MTSPASTSGRMAEYRPELRPGVLLSGELLHGARAVHLVKNTESGKSFEVGVKEHFLISRMDGTRSLGEIGTDYARCYGRRLGDANWQQVLGQLGARGLLTGASAGSPKAASASSEPDSGAESAEEPPRPNNALRGSISLTADADATVARLYRATGFLLAAPWMVPLAVLVLAMETAALVQLTDLLRGVREVFRNPVLLTGVAGLLWVSTALHELAHGVVARHYGGRVTDIGLRWRLPSVIMYCTVDNYLYLSRRRHQIATALAGAAMNLLFLLPFGAVWLLAPLDDATDDALAGLVFLGTLQALAMLVPVPPLDGYKIVGQALGVTELAVSSRAYLGLKLRRDPAAAQYPRRARVAYTGYGIGSMLVLCALVAALGLLVHQLLTLS
ncbi:M50 family metallopeptidase [Streptomyces sp. N2-109]|uniref:M50 family metallopeptidase n=1 Tax=Streptomyces gossypii TaxID=2883101 RepID=A0ABT2JQ92_9ACTN|nr:M50 family metallopeptidase [Streptomyces gossypii]MCT2589684.1 M50 family metallopeptidase [Streptomyces gossypii]